VFFQIKEALFSKGFFFCLRQRAYIIFGFGFDGHTFLLVQKSMEKRHAKGKGRADSAKNNCVIFMPA